MMTASHHFRPTTVGAAAHSRMTPGHRPARPTIGEAHPKTARTCWQGRPLPALQGLPMAALPSHLTASGLPAARCLSSSLRKYRSNNCGLIPYPLVRLPIPHGAQHCGNISIQFVHCGRCYTRDAAGEYPDWPWCKHAVWTSRFTSVPGNPGETWYTLNSLMEFWHAG